MTILDRLFGNQAPAAPDATPPAGTVQQNKTPSGDSAQQNPTVPNSNTPASDGSHPAFPAQDTSDSSKSTTANFADLWKAPEPTNKTPAADPTVLNLGLDPTKLAARVKQMDFSSAFDPALITKEQQGDASAMSQLLNTAIRTGFE